MSLKIEKYEKIGSSKYRIYLDNGEVIDTYDEVILNNELLIKCELDTNLYNKLIIDTKLQEHYNSCIKYISIRIRSTKEIKDYLKKKMVEDEDILHIVKSSRDVVESVERLIERANQNGGNDNIGVVIAQDFANEVNV